MIGLRSKCQGPSSAHALIEAVVTAPLHPAVMGEVAVDAPHLRVAAGTTVAEGSAGAEVVPMVVAEATAEEAAAGAGDTRRPDPVLPVTTTKESEG